jgi:4-hydroxy-tetrahydrodipicolinate reductase
MKKIVIFGICGKVGESISRELIKEKDIDLVGGFDIKNVGMDIGGFLTGEKTGHKILNSYQEVERLKPDIVIDFTNADAAKKTIHWAIDNDINIIVGTTGISKEDLAGIEKKALKSKSKTLIVPNFSIGAVIMIAVSKIIAKYFDSCEIIELHHDKKKDAPSGTSILTAEQISLGKNYKKKRLEEGEKENLECSRGCFIDGIHIHSVRMQGLLAHQNVIFGTRGQTLSIRHDSLDRTSFYPGVILAIRNIDKIPSYTYGLEKLIKI